MINDGKDFKDIVAEMNKCRVLCVACHHAVTSAEQKMGIHKLKRKPGSLEDRFTPEERKIIIMNVDNDACKIIAHIQENAPKRKKENDIQKDINQRYIEQDDEQESNSEQEEQESDE